jgi:hypothetical protein
MESRLFHPADKSEQFLVIWKFLVSCLEGIMAG